MILCVLFHILWFCSVCSPCRNHFILSRRGFVPFVCFVEIIFVLSWDDFVFPFSHCMVLFLLFAFSESVEYCSVKFFVLPFSHCMVLFLLFALSESCHTALSCVCVSFFTLCVFVLFVCFVWTLFILLCHVFGFPFFTLYGVVPVGCFV